MKGKDNFYTIHNPQPWSYQLSQINLLTLTKLADSILCGDSLHIVNALIEKRTSTTHQNVSDKKKCYRSTYRRIANCSTQQSHLPALQGGNNQFSETQVRASLCITVDLGYAGMYIMQNTMVMGGVGKKIKISS